MYDLNKAIEKGWATAPSGEVSDEQLKQMGLLCIRGEIVDGIFPNNFQGREALRRHEVWKKNRRK